MQGPVSLRLVLFFVLRSRSLVRPKAVFSAQARFTWTTLVFSTSSGSRAAGGATISSEHSAAKTRLARVPRIERGAVTPPKLIV